MKIWGILTFLLSIGFLMYTFKWMSGRAEPELDIFASDAPAYAVSGQYMSIALAYSFWLFVFFARLIWGNRKLKPLRADVLDDL
jgi:hypothetical protein